MEVGENMAKKIRTPSFSQILLVLIKKNSLLIAKIGFIIVHQWVVFLPCTSVNKRPGTVPSAPIKCLFAGQSANPCNNQSRLSCLDFFIFIYENKIHKMMEVKLLIFTNFHNKLSYNWK